MNKIFPKYKISAGTQQIISIFMIEQIQKKFLNELKNPVFDPKTFSQKHPGLSSTTCQNLEKKECSNSKQTPGQTDRRTEGRTDPIF